jgi:replicative DNA helicase
MSDTLANHEAEAELLGLLLQDNRGIDAVADIIDAADFHDVIHGRIYEVVLREVSLGKPASPVTIRGYFEGDELEEYGGPRYLMDLTGSCSMLVSPSDLARQVVELAGRRRMRAHLTTASDACSDLSQPIGEIVSFADAALSPHDRETIHQPTGAQCFDELIRSFDEPRHGVTSANIECINELLGPMLPKQLIIAAGRPGMGKTTAAHSYALGAAMRGHGVLFVSLEMSSVELAGKMAADMCHEDHKIPFAAIRDRNPNDWQRGKIKQARDYIDTLPFTVVDTGNLTVGRLNMLIRRHARRMAVKGHKLELVIVDYLQLLSPDTKGRSNYEAVSEVSRSLKAMAKDNGVAIMALAQLSRDVEKRPDKRPQLSDLRDSGQIEQDADAVMFLLRADYYLELAEPDLLAPDRAQWEADMEVARGKIEFIVAKRRNGVTGSAVGLFHGAYQAVRG